MNIGARPDATEPSRRRVVLVRHGVTADNLAGRFVGRTDPSLTDEGAEAARRLAPAVAAIGPVAAVSSPAARAVETAGALGLEEAVLDERLREIDFGRWEGLTRAEAAALDPEAFGDFARGDIVAYPGGDSVAAVRDRALAAVEGHDASPLVLVTHSTVIRIVVAALLGLPVSRYRALLDRPRHLSWTELEEHTSGWRLVTYGADLCRPVP